MSKQQVEQLLDQQAAVATTLLKALNDETEVLSQAQPIGLEAIVERKRLAVLELETIDHAYQALLSDQNKTPSQTEFENLLRALEDKGELFKSWRHIAEILSECRARNNANGQLIRKNQEFCAGALRSLIYLGREQFAPTYTAGGRSHEHHSSRDLGSA